MREPRSAHHKLVALGMSGLLLVASCSGSGGSGASGTGSNFQLTQISVIEGAIWEINRPIEFTFNMDVDPASVGMNTLNIATLTGSPTTGTFFFKAVDLDNDGTKESVDQKIVVFQPTCPTLNDLSDAGLQPGSTPYVLTVLGTTSNTTNVVRSTSGQELLNTQTRNFVTPGSSDPSEAFIDTVNGPPVPVIRVKGKVASAESPGSYIELGGDSEDRTYFLFDETTQTVGILPDIPLNLFSDNASSVAVVVDFNQPISPSDANLSEDSIRLEFQDASLAWIPLDTRVELAANCTESGGARVRLTPIGVLPTASNFRVSMMPGFEDIVGQSTSLELNDFAVASTEMTSFDSLTPMDDNADGLVEEFDISDGASGSFEDTEALFSSTPAAWGDGAATSAFTFSGTGGNDSGDFDWYIGDDEDLFFFDTSSTTIVGGPGGSPTSTQTSVGGRVDVRDLVILEGAILRIQGPNIFTVNATRDVIIRGTLDASGFNAKNVATLNTGAQAEKGGAGAAGGGRGGNASEVLNDSTKRGGSGFGAFALTNGGGLGGESGFLAGTNQEARRPGNGGGGSFGEYPGSIQRIDPEPGDPGAASTTGCVSGQIPAPGGAAGPVPFANADLVDNVFGVRPVTDGAGNLVSLTRGELTQVWAGAGGGGGGDALPSSTCPSPNWTASSDEKGGGGGGGGGSMRINALGKIIFGNAGQIKAEGGQGATGENTNFLDHIGGTGGGGSGGHVILETATQIDFTDGDPILAPLGEYITTQGGLGGQGSTSENPAFIDAGGAGGAGVIQLHVPDPIQQPSSNTAGSIVIPLAGEGDPFNSVSAPTSNPMIQTFGARSEARSRWVSIGGADQDPGGGFRLIEFAFDGLDTTPGPEQGKVLTTSTQVNELTALLTEDLTGNANASIDPDGVTLRLSGMALASLINDPGTISNDIYLRSPALLRNFNLRLSRSSNPSEAFANFDVVSAAYDDDQVVLTVTTSSNLGTLQDFVDSQGVLVVQYELIPRFFRVRTGSANSGLDILEDSSFVRITFDAAPADSNGDPDEDNLLVEGTGDITDFNALMAGELKFFRFNVEFDLDALGAGVSTETEIVSLEFLKIPFKF